MSFTPNYKTYTLKELLIAKNNVCEEKYPERSAEIALALYNKENGIVEEIEAVHDVTINKYSLASRWSRLGASIVDGLIMGVLLIPVMYYSGGFDGLSDEPPTQPSFVYQLIIALIGFSFYCVINWKDLKLNGQTIGKKSLGIKVVHVDGSQPSVWALVFKRYAFFMFIPYLPLIGGVINMISMLMIFGKKKRALHDRVAKTKVITVS